MKMHWVILGVGAFTLQACATVSVTDIGAESKAAQIANETNTNVVLKASEKLNTTFAENGWIEPANYSLKSAAMTLLKGNDVTESVKSQNKYIVNITPEKLRADINTANQIAGKTLSAANVYLEYAEENSDMTLELQSLETALLNCRKAERTFSVVAETKSAGVETELTKMANTVDMLQDTTDDYGRYVRAAKIYTDISRAPVN